MSATRSRVMVFRLSEDEYRALRCACEARGGRNLSEFIRSELMALLSSEPGPQQILRHLKEIVARLVGIERSVEELKVGLPPPGE